MDGKDDFLDTIAHTPVTENNSEPPVEKPEITVADIQDFISPKLYEELAWDENRDAYEVTQNCIDHSLIFAETLLTVAGQKLNLYSDTQKLVVKTLTVYFLYQYNGDKYRASEYMKRAESLISDRYINLEAARSQKPPCAAVSVAPKRRR